MRLASKSRNELFCCRRRTIRVGLRQYFCYRVLKNSRNDFLLRYIDDAVCIQSEFGNDRKADEGEGHKDADIFRYTMCLEGIVQRLHFRRNALCATISRARCPAFPASYGPLRKTTPFSRLGKASGCTQSAKCGGTSSSHGPPSWICCS